MPHQLPALPYAFDALEPHIDAQTMELHHDKHHQAYINNLNAALEKAPEWGSKSIDDIITHLSSAPESIATALRNNGGGHYNHTMFWSIMKPGGGGDPTGPIAGAISADFGSFDELKSQFNSAGLKRFGSGWVWLVVDNAGKLKVMSTANQDCPLTDGLHPVMGNDVWEHAYYLKYQNRRAEYLAQWWNTLDWDAVNERYRHARA